MHGLRENGRRGDPYEVKIFSLELHREPQRAVQNSRFPAINPTANFICISVYGLVVRVAGMIVFEQRFESLRYVILFFRIC